MRIYKYWASAQNTNEVGGIKSTVTGYGGSDFSLQDAREKADQKFKLLQKKIAGDKTAFENYQVEIREELIKRVDNFINIC